jgi:hypothetical protein
VRIGHRHRGRPEGPCWWMFREGWGLLLGHTRGHRLGHTRGFSHGHGHPLMLLKDVGAIGAFTDVDGLVVRELLPHEAAAHASVVAKGFGLPVELFRQFVTPAVLALSGVHCYLGESTGYRPLRGLGSGSALLSVSHDIEDAGMVPPLPPAPLPMPSRLAPSGPGCRRAQQATASTSASVSWTSSVGTAGSRPFEGPRHAATVGRPTSDLRVTRKTKVSRRRACP